IFARDDDLAWLRRADIVSRPYRLAGGRARYICSSAWHVFECALNFPLRHDTLAASISAGSSHFEGHGPMLTAAQACGLPVAHHPLNSVCSTASCWHASCLPALQAGVCVSSGAVDSMATLVSLSACTIV